MTPFFGSLRSTRTYSTSSFTTKLTPSKRRSSITRTSSRDSTCRTRIDMVSVFAEIRSRVETLLFETRRSVSKCRTSNTFASHSHSVYSEDLPGYREGIINSSIELIEAILTTRKRLVVDASHPPPSSSPPDPSLNLAELLVFLFELLATKTFAPDWPSSSSSVVSCSSSNFISSSSSSSSSSS